MRLVGDPGFPPGSLLCLVHLSPEPPPFPSSPSCPIAAHMLGPPPTPWILLQGHPAGTDMTGEGERQSWKEGLEEDWCRHCCHGNDRLGLRPHCQEQLLQLFLDSRAFEGRQEAQVGALRTQVGPQGDSQWEGRLWDLPNHWTLREDPSKSLNWKMGKLSIKEDKYFLSTY